MCMKETKEHKTQDEHKNTRAQDEAIGAGNYYISRQIIDICVVARRHRDSIDKVQKHVKIFIFANVFRQTRQVSV